jgi:hypothetical protein
MTAPDSPLSGGPASQQMLVNGDDPSPGVALTDLGEPGSQGPVSLTAPGSAIQTTPPTGAGGSSNFAAPAAGSTGRSGGFAVSGGLPAQSSSNAGYPAASARGGSGGKDSAAVAAPAGQLSAVDSTAAPTLIAAPAGHFAAQLQTLLHSGDTNGSFSLTGAANQQSQIGALVGGQLTNAVGLGSADAASHRPASLLGQTLANGSSQNLGLRTSDSSSGMFGLVGSQSIGDLVDGPDPESGNALANGAAALAGAVSPRDRCRCWAARLRPTVSTRRPGCQGPSLPQGPWALRSARPWTNRPAVIPRKRIPPNSR